MSEELRPCLFCGEDDDITANLRDGWFYVSCNKCGALTHMFYRRKSEAIKAWNTRPIEDALNARIAELEAEIDQLTAHDATERKDDKSPNDTQTQTIVYQKECEK